jgi:hypothetical protein
MTSSSGTTLPPWPGPRPYGENEAGFYFGRNADVHDLTKTIDANRLTIVIGQSGTGKTSLLRAGVIPGLRQRRQKDEATTPSRLATPLVLLAREWSGARAADAAAVFMEPIRHGVREVPLGVREREELISVADRSLDLLEFLTETCRQQGALILVVDQLEETFRLPVEHRREVIRQLVEAYRFHEQVSLVLSLRQDAVGDDVWTELQNRLFPFHQLTYRVEPMTDEQLKYAIWAAARTCELRLDEDEIGRLLGWAAQQDSPGEGPRDEASDGSVNLLALQAVLWDVYRFALDYPGWTAERWLSLRLLGDYEKDRGTPVSTGAFRRYIDNALSSPSDPVMSAAIGGLSADATLALIRHVVARMLPWLSSGGFKTHILENALLDTAVGDESASLAAAARDDGTTAAASGPARRWTVAKTSAALDACCREGLRRLRSGAIIRSTWTKKGDVHVLTHDALATPLGAWSAAQKRSFADSVASLVVHRGMDFAWKDAADTDVHDVAYLGCVFHRVTFDRARFVDCVFTGCVFMHCGLTGTQFERCEMHGSVFIRGEIEGRTTFSSCRAHGIVLDGTSIGDPIFSRCCMDGLTVKGADLLGEALFERCSLRFMQLSGLAKQGRSKDGGVLVLDRCLLDMSCLDVGSRDAVVIRDNCLPEPSLRPFPPSAGSLLPLGDVCGH